MKAVKKIESIGRNAWLAGVGVYQEGWRNTTDKFDKFYVDGNALIQELIEKGESVESELQSKLKGKVMLDEKITALKAKLGFYKESKDVQLDRLSSKVDDLIEVVAKLAQQKAEEKIAAKKAAEKAAATTEQKATENKPAAKTTRTRKTAAKPAATKAKTEATAEEKKAPAKPRTRRTTAASKSTTKSATKTTTRKTAAKKDD